MMLLLRRLCLPAATIGILELGEHRWWTLEPPREGPHPCVPEGEYALEPHDGARWKGTWALVGPGVVHWPTVQDDDRETVLFHPGNRPDETRGCILLGTGVLLRGPTLLGSRQAFEEFRAIMREQPGASTLRIVRG